MDDLRLLVTLRARPDTLYVTQNRTALATNLDGFVEDGREHGLFVSQTRLLSRYRYLIDGRPPQAISLSNVEQHTWLGYYGVASPNPAYTESGPLGPGGKLAQETIELRLSRFVSDGFHENVDITNFTTRAATLTLQLELDADFADPSETAGERQQKGILEREWRRGADDSWELAFDYRVEHAYAHQEETGIARLHRGVIVRVNRATSPPAYEDGRLRFSVELAPKGTWHACIDAIPLVDGQIVGSRYACRSFVATDHEFDRKRAVFGEQAARIAGPARPSLPHAAFAAINRARHDLATLRLHDMDHGSRGFVPAAGLPVYLALFGRDTLTAAWQAALISGDLLLGVLPEIAKRQGTRTNDWRDEQPGRMLHQAETGPLALLNFNPNALNYFSVTTAAFYPVVVATLWHWTGDKDLVRQFIVPALKGLQWLDDYSDVNGDGFYEYQTRSKDGLKHQAWKDSIDAIVYPDGSQVDTPIAACEQQAYVYAAKYLLAEVLWWLGEKDEAKRLGGEAADLKKRFNDAFWMEDEQYLAMGLDPHGKPIRSIGSNAGHCVAAGIVEQERVEAIARRMLAEDMFSGWGVRTLSSRHPAYNPYSYHRGSVWPVEHGTFAIAFSRYGLFDAVQTICRAQFEAASLFEAYRLPELFAGHQRDAEHPFPSLYPRANSPQAWSASAVFCLIQALLGLYPYAPLKALLVDPHLPEWLPDITIENLHVGNATVSLRFFRKGVETDYEVLDKQGTVHVVRQPSPWSLTAGFGERLKDALLSVMPGK